MAFAFSAGGVPDGAIPLTELPAKQLAISFVPNLVVKYIYLTSKNKSSELKERESEIFDVLYWEFGPK